MTSFIHVAPGSFRTRPQLCLCHRRLSATTHVRRKQPPSACATPANPDDGTSPIAAADLKLLTHRITELRQGLVAEDRLLARNWAEGRHSQKVVACVPGSNFVRRLAADGTLLVCGTADGALCLFDTATGERAVRTNANTGQTTAVCVGGAYVAAVGSSDQCIAVWDVSAYRASRDWAAQSLVTFDGPALPAPNFRLTGHDNIITALAVDVRSRTLYSASVDGTMREWCLETGVCRNIVRVGDPVLCMRLNGRYLLAGTASGRIQAYLATRGTHLLTMQAHESPTTAIYFHEDTQMLASGSASGDIKLWDYNKGHLLGEPDPHDGAVMALHLDEARVVSASRDGTVAVATVTDARRLYAISGYSVFITSLVVERERIIADGTHNLITARSFMQQRK